MSDPIAVLEGRFPAASSDVISDALQRSLTWDTAGRPPGADGYSLTYDLDWASAEVCDMLALTADAAGPSVEQVTSEGTTIKLAGGTDWLALAARWRARSPLAAMAGIGSTLGVIDIEQGPTYVPASEAVRW